MNEESNLLISVGGALAMLGKTKGWEGEVELVQIAPSDEPRPDASWNGLTEAIHRSISAVGWCRFQSAAGWGGSDTWPEEAEAGRPVYAEWVDSLVDRKVYWRFRHLPGEGPQFWSYRQWRLHEVHPAQHNATTFLRVSRRMLARHLTGVTALNYHVFMGTGDGEDEDATRQVFELFAGVER